MTILYTTGMGNRLIVSRIVDDSDNNPTNNPTSTNNANTTSLTSTLRQEVLQVIDPIVDPLPEGIGKNEAPSPKFATEWVSVHPTQQTMVVSLTSFWQRAQAILTVFDVVVINNDDNNNNSVQLKRRCQIPTGGYQACQGVWSPDGSHYVVAHHNGGMISWFDVASWSLVRSAEMPLRIPGTRVEPQQDWWGFGNPSCHGLCYHSTTAGTRHLIAVDPRQNMIVTFPVDAQGKFVKKKTEQQQEQQQHSSARTVKFQSPVAWFWGSIVRLVFGNSTRPRRAVPHPNGQYLYVLSENANAIQVLPLHGPNGSSGIDDAAAADCLQELKLTTLDNSNDSGWVGPALIAAAELHVTPYGLIVSVRGTKLWGGRCESGIYFVDFLDKSDGSRLRLGNVIPIAGIIRHFCVDDGSNETNPPILWVGNESGKQVCKYQVIREQDNTTGMWRQNAKLLGEFDVDVNVMCIATSNVPR
mmetsp:Transcript_14517/g.31670  ORF Transcript_14517/g.31670 Transcript_14517/m.31670 type:complete len:470 (+) Transcript_14517:177-1586(+)